MTPITHETLVPPLTWHLLDTPLKELQPDLSLAMGQCFNWKKHAVSTMQNAAHENIWIGVVSNVPIAIKQTHSRTYFSDLRCTDNSDSTNELQASIRIYFNLDQCLSQLYSQWSEACGRMKIVTQSLTGERTFLQRTIDLFRMKSTQRVRCSSCQARSMGMSGVIHMLIKQQYQEDNTNVRQTEVYVWKLYLFC